MTLGVTPGSSKGLIVSLLGSAFAGLELLDEYVAPSFVDDCLDLGVDVVGEHKEVGWGLADCFVLALGEFDGGVAVVVCAFAEEVERKDRRLLLRDVLDLLFTARNRASFLASLA